MLNLLVVGLGGFIGSVLRYLTGTMVLQLSREGAHPWGTAVVNVVGCLLIGLLGRWFESAEQVPPQLRLFLMVGLLGGFTTFSAFGYETLLMLRDRQLGLGGVQVDGRNVELKAWPKLLEIKPKDSRSALQFAEQREACPHPAGPFPFLKNHRLIVKIEPGDGFVRVSMDGEGSE